MLLQIQAFADVHFLGLIFMFFAVAFLYASVGFGGGSSYLALLALFGVAYAELRIVALICNIVVVSGNVLLYFKKGFYKDSKILSLIGLSVPLAFLGGLIQLEASIFYILLGITLILAAVLMVIPKKVGSNTEKKKSHLQNSLIGGAIGFLSGLAGIGGGIFLSPYLNLSRFDTAIRIAAYSSLFILVNSIAGILGQLTTNIQTVNYQLIIALAMSVLLGGQLGVRVGIKNLSPIWLKRIIAILIALVGARILWTQIV